MSASLADLPTITFPDSYELEMPSFLARAAAEHGPIFKHDWMPGQSTVYMVGPEANEFILRTHREHFSSDHGWTPVIGEIFGKGLINMDDPEHARDRKLMNPGFAIAFMSRYLPIMQRVIAERTRVWAASDSVDVYQEARKITFDVAAEALAGIPTGPEADRLRELFYAIIGAQFTTNIQTEQEWFAHITPVHAELRTMLLRMIAERRAEPEDAPRSDVLALLVHARDEQGGGLSDEALLGHLNILLVAGHETSTTLTAWLLYELATHPDELAHVHAELDTALPRPEAPASIEMLRGLHVLGNALTEAGRLHPPAGNVPRGVVRPFEFAGYTIPAGARVLYSIAASHRLPSVFRDPDRFDPDRFATPRAEDRATPFALVTFGGGPRVCIGMNFAQTEIKALAAHLLRTHTVAPVAGHEPAMVYFSPVGFIPTGVELRVMAR
ncbi:MAG: cytochrome P450 [Ktedonobacterales bacterium]